MATIDQIVELVKAKQPVIWVNAYEERRVIDEIIESDIVGLEKVKGKDGKGEVMQVSSKKQLYVWSCTQGLVKVEGQAYKDIDSLQTADTKTTQPPSALLAIQDTRINFETTSGLVCIMRDLHTMMSVPMTGRKLKDIFMHLGRKNKTIIIVGPSNEVPSELIKDLYVVDYDFPTFEMISKIFDKMLLYVKKRENVTPDKEDARYVIIQESGGPKKYRVEYSKDEKDAVIHAAQGLTAQEILCAFSKSLLNTPNGEILYDRIAEEKKNIIKRSETLEFWTKTEPMNEVGGNEELKKWLISRGHAIAGKAVEFGVRPPKGCIVTGIQGCGKSMVAKAVANAWKLPCVRLDMGKIFAGLVGASEKNMRTMIKQAEAMAPIVLWVDEIEKGLSGTGSSNFSDGGTTSRVFGTFVWWMQEKKPGIFVIATANDVSKLPPELLRKGRFDTIWFVDLPTQEERRDIFETHIRRVERDPKKFDLDVLAAAQYKGKDGKRYDYSGAEIEEAVNDALFDAYEAHPKTAKINGKDDITTEGILAALTKTIPISCTASDRVVKIRKWGRKHARFASAMSEARSTETSQEPKKEEDKADKPKDINPMDSSFLDEGEEAEFADRSGGN